MGNKLASNLLKNSHRFRAANEETFISHNHKNNINHELYEQDYNHRVISYYNNWLYATGNYRREHDQ